ERGIDGGATAVVDGRGAAAPEGGSFVGPTVLDGVTADMDIAQEEVFGPVLSVIHADSLDEAIQIVNGSRYGNGTSLFTESGAAARRYRHDVQVGMVGINIGVAAPVAIYGISERTSARIAENMTVPGVPFYGVNPTKQEACGVRCYPSMAACPAVPE